MRRRSDTTVYSTPKGGVKYLVLYALMFLLVLAPCTVRGSVQKLFGTEFKKSLVTTKSTAPHAETCSVAETETLSVASGTTYSAVKLHPLFPISFSAVRSSEKLRLSGVEAMSLDGRLPLYLLYKQWKVFDRSGYMRA